MDSLPNFDGIPKTDIKTQALKDVSINEVTCLNLEGNKIGRDEMEEIRALLKSNYTITYLSLANNKIERNACYFLKQILSEHTTIKFLDLRDNQIDDCKHLVAALQGNKTLVYLNLHSIKPQELTELKGVQDLGTAIFSNPSLTYLNLSKNSIGEELGQQIGEALQGHQSLRYLNLDENPVESNAALAIATFLRDTSSLTFLSLGGFVCSVDVCSEFGKALGANTTLQCLELNNFMDDEGSSAVIQPLQHNSVLTKLSLKDNLIGRAGAEALAVALSSNSTLVHLDLSNNKMDDASASTVGNALKKNTSLKELQLQGKDSTPSATPTNVIGASGLKALIDGTNISFLGIEKNKVESAGMRAIGIALHNNSALKTLALPGNEIYKTYQNLIEVLLNKPYPSNMVVKGNIGDAGAEVLAEVLLSNSVKQLQLNSCSISDTGAIALGAALAVNTSLTELNLGGNKIDNTGCASIANSLGENHTLTAIDLSYNNIASEGCKALGNLLSKNTTLNTVNITGNPIDASGLVELGRALLKNTTITNLSVTDEKTSQNAGVQALMNIISSRPIPKSLDLKGKKIDSIGARLLRYIISAEDVVTLDLEANRVGNDGIAELSSSLENHATLTYINIADNNIDFDGAPFIGTVLKRNSTLSEIVLQKNNFGNTGVAAILEGAAKSRSLKSLNLSDTSITNDAAKFFSEAIGSNSSITSLDLSNNPKFDEAGIKVLLSVLKYHNATLQDIPINVASDLQKNSFESLFHLNTKTQAQFKPFIPDEVLQQGAKACDPYVQKLEAAKDEYKSMKIYVVGNNKNVEKGLVKFLLGPDEEYKPTPHVNAAFPTNLFEGIDANVWEICGKRKYRSTYRQILSRNTVHVLCFNLDDANEAYNSLTKQLKWLHTHLVDPTAHTTPLYKILLVGIYNSNEVSFTEKFTALCSMFPGLPIHNQCMSVCPAQQQGREELIKTITDISISILRENPEPNIPISFSNLRNSMQDLQDSLPSVLSVNSFRSSLADNQDINLYDEEFKLLMDCLHYSGLVYVAHDTVFLKPQTAAKVLSTFICPKTHHFLRAPENLGVLSEDAVKKQLAKLPFKLVSTFLQSVGLCYLDQGKYYFPRMTPFIGIPQFKSEARTRAGFGGIRFFSDAVQYLITSELFCDIQVALLKSLQAEEKDNGKLDFESTNYYARIVSNAFNGELVLVLDRNELQMHLFIVSSESIEQLFAHARRVIEDHLRALPHGNTKDDIVEDFTSMQDPTKASGLTQKAVMSNDLADIEISYYGLKLMNTLGSGGFGMVVAAVYSGRLVAVKILNVTRAKLTDEALMKFKDEIKVMKSINSDYVVKLYGACTEPKLAIVMELLGGGDLSGVLYDPKVQLTWEIKLSYAEDIARGIMAMHQRNPPVLHCDLKTDNILLDKERTRCKLADFGLATMKASHSKSVERGTIVWMAPELLDHPPKFSVFSDIYAFGMILWAIVTRQKPYNNVDVEDVEFYITSNQTPAIPDDPTLPPGLKELIESCWAEERPTADQALEALTSIKNKLLVNA